MFKDVPRTWECWRLDPRTEQDEERIWSLIQRVDGRVSVDSRFWYVLFWVRPEHSSLIPLCCDRVHRWPKEDYL
jgi:hypothetical protein